MSVSPTTKRNTNFTEGSWRVNWTVDNDGVTRFDILKNDADADDYGRTVDASYSIIESAYPVLENDDESKANANLIAAAPDLYDALMGLRDAAKACCADPILLRRADMALAYALGQDWRGDEDES